MKPSDIHPNSVSRILDRYQNRQLEQERITEAQRKVKAIHKHAAKTARDVAALRAASLTERGLTGAPSTDSTGLVVLEKREDTRGDYSVVGLVRTFGHGSEASISETCVQFGVALDTAPPDFSLRTNRDPTKDWAQTINDTPMYVEWLQYESTRNDKVRVLLNTRQPLEAEIQSGQAMLASMVESISIIAQAAVNTDLNPLTRPPLAE